MEHGFETHPSGAIIALTEGERALLMSLGRQEISLLSERAGPTAADPLASLVGISDRSDVPSDPVLARLLPSAYESEDDASEFRRYTEDELLKSKIQAAQAVIEDLEASHQFVVVDVARQHTWLTFLNDLRLALGTRIGVREDAMEELSRVSDDDPRLPMLLVYDWLSFVQGSLVEVLMTDVPDSGREGDDDGAPGGLRT